jgi:FAD/FMN-containing dehydrogenase
MKPFVADVESLVLIDATGTARRCDRRENAELFRLAVGGYGLFGIIASVTLRLAPRQPVERVVELLDADALMPAFARRIDDGFLFGDFQFATDTTSDGFLRRGVFSCYRPVDGAPPDGPRRELSAADWQRLLYLAHVDKRRAFEEYAGYYLTTSGQRYWSDTHQMSVYLDAYHDALDRRLRAAHPASEMITEVSVPRDALPRFLADVRADFRRHETDLIYSTVRLIERDDESFLGWAKEPLACVSSTCTRSTPAGIARSVAAFRRLIDHGIAHGGTSPDVPPLGDAPAARDLLPAVRRFPELKRRYDPAERFRSDWYHHHRTMFAERGRVTSAAHARAAERGDRRHLRRAWTTADRTNAPNAASRSQRGPRVPPPVHGRPLAAPRNPRASTSAHEPGDGRRPRAR